MTSYALEQETPLVMELEPPVDLDQLGARSTWQQTLLTVIEHFAGAVLAINVLVVFASVIFRYFLHTPLDWAEEVASGLMGLLIFLGAGSVLGRGQHIGLDFFVAMFPLNWRAAIQQLGAWLTVALCLGFMLSTVDLLVDTWEQTTSFGFPQYMFTLPVLIGCVVMAVFSISNAMSLKGSERWPMFILCATLVGIAAGWNALSPSTPIPPIAFLSIGFVGCLLLGMPIAFAIALAALLYFLSDPSLTMLTFSQQIIAGANHFVLLAIPFFVLAGLTMEANGMSTRLIELLLRLLGRYRGGLSLITIISTALFSGVSGSKLADVAAVGGIIVPAVRRTDQDPNEAAGLLACTAIMSETIPPCVNMIIFGFVASISIGGLFMAGIVPAVLLAVGLASLAVYFGKRVDVSKAVEVKRSLPRLIGGSLVALFMIMMIGKGVTAGVATSTEISAFAVLYALIVGGLTFRELTLKSIVQLFVRSASMTGVILFIVAAASSLSYALTIERIPNQLAEVMISLGHQFGANVFMVISALIMMLFGMILEGAPALILFGPLLTPIATQLGVNPLQFGTVMVVAMGLGFFAPPLGLGLFATCAITGTEVKNVARPMMKYLAVLLLGLLCLIFVPSFSLWLPHMFGFK